MLVIIHEIISSVSHPPGKWEVELVIYFFSVNFIQFEDLMNYRERISVLLACSDDRTESHH